MTSRSMIWTACCWLACLLAMAGCRPSAEQLAPVKGKVLYRGQPLQGGVIVFIPDSSRGTSGHLAVADIQPDGTFTLKTNDVLGAVPGHHKVTVSWVLPTHSGGPPQSMLPPKYRDPQQSKVTCEVMANKSNTIDFVLE
jgi:hypothetical protein